MVSKDSIIGNMRKKKKAFATPASVKKVVTWMAIVSNKDEKNKTKQK
jgi:hypothetical protein